MNWNTLASTLLGALITYSAILLTQAIELWKRKRAHESLTRALLQALHEEVGTLLEMARMNAPSTEDIPDGKPYERLFTANQDYFTVYHASTSLVMQIKQAGLRRSIFETYLRAKSLLDTVSMNRLYLERYHYLQSTFLKTRDPSAQSACENYQQMLIQIAAQLRRADAGFRNAATRLLELLSTQLASPRLNTSHESGRLPLRAGPTGESLPVLSPATQHKPMGRSSMPAKQSSAVRNLEPEIEKAQHF